MEEADATKGETTEGSSLELEFRVCCLHIFEKFVSMLRCVTEESDAALVRTLGPGRASVLSQTHGIGETDQGARMSVPIALC